MSAESPSQSATVQSADSGSAGMTMIQQQSESENEVYVQPFTLHVDSWYKEYVQALRLEEDVESLMKKNKNMVKNVHLYSNYERNLNLFLISQRTTKLWQILDRLDALWRNPDRTRIIMLSEQDQRHRQKLLEEERCKVMQLCMDFEDYRSRSSRPEKIKNGNSEPQERPRPNYYITFVNEEVTPQTQQVKASSDDYPSSNGLRLALRLYTDAETLEYIPNWIDSENDKESDLQHQVKIPVVCVM